MTEIPEQTQAAIAEVLNRLPEVRWDRVTADPGQAIVFGWVERLDERSDFVVVTFELGQTLAFSFVTSSAEWSKEFARRLFGDVDEYAPCARVEDLLGEHVRNPTRLAPTSSDPRRAGGDVVGPEGVSDTLVDTKRAVLVDAIAVVLLELERERADPPEVAIGVLLEGPVNKSEPRERARVLNLMGWGEAAGMMVELEALAHRTGHGAVLTKLLYEHRRHYAEPEQ